MLVSFVIGGITGIYLADLPTDEILHGGMFVTAHFHFTLVGSTQGAHSTSAAMVTALLSGRAAADMSRM